jgi:dTDP-4-dehydrorhamnose reductase
MKILILGITGMLGNTLFRYFSRDKNFKVFGTLRSNGVPSYLSQNSFGEVVGGVDVENQDSLVRTFAEVKPQIVINCIGIVKQLAVASDPLHAIPINSILPHRLAILSEATGARLIHISTDCVFSGLKGNYTEDDFPDCYDLYGRSKLLGEVDYPNAITLRTSIIGHELSGNRSLINWFLSQENKATGFTKAIYSGLPTFELAEVIDKYVIPHPQMHGLHHVSSDPINKYELLKLVRDVYKKDIEIEPSDKLVIDRSLNSERFKSETGYRPPIWSKLIQKMYEFK